MKDKFNIIIGILIISCIVVLILLYIDNQEEEKAVIPPTLSLNPQVIVMKVGETRSVYPTVNNLSDYTIEWQSDNINVATVNNGIIKGINPGVANITATIQSNNLTATSKVIVKDVEPESIKLNKNNIELKIEEKDTLEYTLLPDNTTNKQVTWKSSNSNVATVNDGIVEALSEGTTNITITASNGISDTCIVNVKTNEISVSSIKFNKNAYSLYINETININATVLPENATDKTLIWKSSNNKIATVNNGTVKGISKGKVTITATDSKGLVSHSVDVTINKKIVNINPQEITIIGDSRMVMLCSYKWYKNDGGTCVSKSAMGYNWLVETAIPTVNRLSNKQKKYIVTNMGVNDLGHISKYIDTYRKLANGDWKNYHIFLLSVNPTSGSMSSKNATIESFNNNLKKGLKSYKNVTYCDSYSYLKKNGFKSGDGLHYKEESSKVIYEQIKKCIYDYYNE